MKKLLVPALALVAATGLAACSERTQDQAAATADNAAADMAATTDNATDDVGAATDNALGSA